MEKPVFTPSEKKAYDDGHHNGFWLGYSICLIMATVWIVLHFAFVH